MDVSFVEKDLPESKQARHHLGLGMPEARALQKRCGVSTFRELARWYLTLTQHVGDAQAQSELQKVVCSSAVTVKLVALILLANS